VKIEVLVPDLGGRREAVRRVVSAGPDIFGHNIETVPRLYGTIRPGADYTRSLEVLRWAGEFACGLPTKSSILLGFGEEEWEVVACMKDLRRAGCGILAIGQYLRPTRRHIRVARFIPPEEFAHYEDLAYGMGFKAVSSGPFVRSSYQSADKYQ
jgi:lipoic acid synthetase